MIRKRLEEDVHNPDLDQESDGEVGRNGDEKIER